MRVYSSNIIDKLTTSCGSEPTLTAALEVLTSLAQKCYQMYYQCIHQRLYHLTPAEYEDFTGIILHARKVR